MVHKYMCVHMGGAKLSPGIGIIMAFGVANKNITIVHMCAQTGGARLSPKQQIHMPNIVPAYHYTRHLDGLLHACTLDYS